MVGIRLKLLSLAGVLSRGVGGGGLQPDVYHGLAAKRVRAIVGSSEEYIEKSSNRAPPNQNIMIGN